MSTASRRSRQPVPDTPVKLPTPPRVLHQTEHVAVGIVQHPRTALWVAWLWKDPYFWYLMGYEQQEEAIACAHACFGVFAQSALQRAEGISAAINEIVWQRDHDLFPPPHEARVEIMELLGHPLSELPALVWPKKDLRSTQAVEEAFVDLMAHIIIRIAQEQQAEQAKIAKPTEPSSAE